MFTRRDVTRLVVKALGLLVLLSTAVTLPGTISIFDQVYSYWMTANTPDRSSALAMSVAVYFGPIAVYTAFGCGLIWWSRRLVEATHQGAEDGSLPAASNELKDMETSLVTVIGLYFLVDGFSELLQFAFLGVTIHELNGSVSFKSVWTNLNRFEVVKILQFMAKLTIGAALVLGRGATVATLRQARHWVKKWRAWPDEPEQVERG
ncbi:hypothetical protein ACQR1I_19635 [Bradyrhizobium sp. HKCCYLS2038]|uniref:hypothetical protein n=1 Tax=unclassified Bradyrhizobium TaxID=2631580 RepID=UPI003EBA0E20